jgi:hypothetical protein
MSANHIARAIAERAWVLAHALRLLERPLEATASVENDYQRLARRPADLAEARTR